MSNFKLPAISEHRSNFADKDFTTACKSHLMRGLNVDDSQTLSRNKLSISDSIKVSAFSLPVDEEDSESRVVAAQSDEEEKFDFLPILTPRRVCMAPSILPGTPNVSLATLHESND